MDIKIHAKPIFSLPLTRTHIDALIVMSKHHYDARCKMASQQGGFIYGWNNQLRFEEQYVDLDQPRDPFSVDATHNDLDTTLKILESIRLCEHAGLISNEAATLCRQLSYDLNGAISLASEKYAEWQTVFTTRAR